MTGYSRVVGYGMELCGLKIVWYGTVRCGRASDKSRGNGVIKVMK